jgi:hypothetical protein
MVRNFGFGPLVSNALASIGLFIQIPVSWCFSYISDHLYVLKIPFGLSYGY